LFDVKGKDSKNKKTAKYSNNFEYQKALQNVFI